MSWPAPILALALSCTLGAGVATADGTRLPSLFDVTGVASDDVLNIRQGPDAGSPIIGVLAPDAKAVEVVALQDGWAAVNAGEGAGFVNATYLAARQGPAWDSLNTPIRCFGTEPFWSLNLDLAAKQSRFSTPESDATLVIGQIWPGSDLPARVAVELDKAFLVMTPQACSDGMSDRAFGIAASLFFRKADGAALHGCCSIAP